MKLRNLKKSAGETKVLTGAYSPAYLQFSVDLTTGEIITDYHYDLGHSWRTRYHDDNIVEIGITNYPMTMKEIKEWIFRTLADRNISHNLEVA